MLNFRDVSLKESLTVLTLDNWRCAQKPFRSFFRVVFELALLFIV